MIKLIYIILILFSVILPSWHYYGMNSVISLNKDNNADAITDNTNLGNSYLSSSANLRVENNSKVLTCQIKAHSKYPFCEISFNLATPFEPPIDLSHFDNIEVVTSYESPNEQEDQNLRLVAGRARGRSADRIHANPALFRPGHE